MERLEFSVEKILKAKYWAGLNEYKPVALEDLNQDLNTVQDSLLHAKLVESSITLLKNQNGVFPIKDLESTKIAYVKLGDAPSDVFLGMLQNYKNITEVQPDENGEYLNKLKKYSKVIVGYHKSNSNPWKSFKFKQSELDVLEKIAAQNEVFLNVFASPYALLDVKSFPQ